MKLDSIDKGIIRILKRRKHITAYSIAKELNCAWSTANTHCMKLCSEGIVEYREERACRATETGAIKRFWSLK